MPVPRQSTHRHPKPLAASTIVDAIVPVPLKPVVS